MKRSWIRTQRFQELGHDRWRQSVGALSEAESVRLGRRLLLYRSLAMLRGIARFPWGFIRGIIHLLHLMDELERLHFGPMRHLTQGEGCVVDRQTWLVNGHRIRFGDFVKLSAFSTIMAGEKAKVEVGTNTIIGPGVIIVAFNHGMANTGVPMRYQDYVDEVSNSISIGKDVWIGANAVILPGAKLGDGCVIGAGTIVKGEVPPGTITVTNLRDHVQRMDRR